MIITGIDLETTGLKAEEGHQIVEIALAVYKRNAPNSYSKVGSTFRRRIKPTRPIDAAAQQVHGISMADLAKAPAWDAVAPTVSRILASTHLLVAHNIGFDVPFLAVELNRVGMTLPNLDVFCTMENGRNTTALGKLPSLKQLCWAHGLEYDDNAAHAADYDIDLTMQCFFKGWQRGWFTLEKYREVA